MKGVTLRAQMTRASMLTTLVALLLSAGSLLAYEFLAFRRAGVEDLRTQAELIAHASEAAVSFNDHQVAQENLELLRKRPRVRSAAIYLANGSPFTTFSFDPTTAPPARADPGLIDLGSRFAGSTLEVSYPIEHDGERIGTVYVNAEHEVWRLVATYAAILGAVTAGSLAFAYLMFGRLQRVVIEPLTRMTDVAEAVIQRRDWSLRAPSSDNRDIAVLVGAFNGMLSEVESRTGELEREMVVRQRAEGELRAADRKKDEFLATLAHELRNPLAPMTTAVALIRLADATPVTRSKAIAILERQLRHLARLIDDLLDISRLATGKLSLRKEDLDVVAAAREAVELVEPIALERGLRLSGQFPSERCVVVGDSARLLQVFSNLLSNACRYTPPGGRIDVAVEVLEGQVEVAVRDTGMGIESAMQEKIFDLFEQADKSLERGNTGLGIGLTLARQLVHLHGGEISVESKGIGQGSTFIVRLPNTAARAVATPAGEVAGGLIAAASMHVVLADDNVDFAESMRAFLEMHGHRATVVHDGEAALAAIREQQPDAAVLDIGMPVLNGYEVARRLRADPATAAVTLIAVTGWGQPGDKEAAANAGFDRHLLKPVDVDELMAVLSSFRRPARPSAPTTAALT